MPNVSAAAKSRLLSALDSVTDALDAGLPPVQALAKAARDHKLPDSYIEPLTHSFNLGSTRLMQTTTDDVVEKMADFPVCDPEDVRELLRQEGLDSPNRQKTASADFRDSVSGDYMLRPATVFQARDSDRRAGQPLPAIFPAGPEVKRASHYQDPLHDNAVKRAQAQTLQWERDQAAQQLERASRSLKVATSRLSNHLLRLDTCSYDWAMRAARSGFGDSGAAVIEDVARRNPNIRQKRARADRRFVTTDDPVFALVSEVLDCRDAHREAEQKVAIALERLRGLTPPEPPTEDELLMDSLLNPKVATPAADPDAFLDDLLPTKTASLTGTLLGGAMGGMGVGAGRELSEHAARAFFGSDSSPASVLAEIDSPDHAANLRKIQYQAILHDLMMNDDVISGYPPQEVMAAANDIVRLAPRIQTQPLPLQSSLRQRLGQGSLDMFQEDQLLGIENKLRSRDTVSPAPAPSEPDRDKTYL